MKLHEIKIFKVTLNVPSYAINLWPTSHSHTLEIIEAVSDVPELDHSAFIDRFVVTLLNRNFKNLKKNKL